MAIVEAVQDSIPAISTVFLIASVVVALFLGVLLREMCERFDIEFKGMYRRPAVVQIEYIRKPSLLLALPPELRNRIWEHTLVSREPHVKIDKETWRQPPLLRTCKQIRQEAGPMYYGLNKFHMIQIDLDFEATVRFCQAARAIVKCGVPKMSYFAGPLGQPNWDGFDERSKGRTQPFDAVVSISRPATRCPRCSRRSSDDRRPLARGAMEAGGGGIRGVQEGGGRQRYRVEVGLEGAQQ
ncbi:hypothetical protein LTR17_002435 [Elasticomyces elasticus]|nr:hypothetical protein LTR17_002435 [Elasticomyces elasticus]